MKPHKIYQIKEPPNLIKLRRRDPAEESRIYREFSAVGFNYLKKFTSDDATSYDLTQEALIRFFMAIEKIPQDKNLIAYFKRICYNLFVDFYRKKQKQGTVELTDNIADILAEEEKEQAQFVNVAGLSIPTETALKLLTQTKENNLGDQECLSMINYKYLESKSIKEIFVIMDLSSEEYTKTKLYRCVKKMKKKIIKLLNK